MDLTATDAQVHITVSPTLMVCEGGSKDKVPAGATVTVYVVATQPILMISY